MKKTVALFGLLFAFCLGLAAAAYAEDTQTSSVNSNYLYINTQTYSFNDTADAVITAQEDGYVRVDIPGVGVTGADGQSGLLSFSFFLPADAWYSLLY